jgi:RIO-like serine/threonine protein kinase
VQELKPAVIEPYGKSKVGSVAIFYRAAPGIDLYQWVREGGNKGNYTKIVSKVKSALAEIHKHGIVFGDIHAGHVIVAPDLSVKLVGWDTAVWAKTDDRYLKIVFDYDRVVDGSKDPSLAP